MKATTVSKLLLRNPFGLAQAAHGFAERLGWHVAFHQYDYDGHEHFEATDYE
jgi:hypothetical protein